MSNDSILVDPDQFEASVVNSMRTWRGVSEDDLGVFGMAEMIQASANFFNEGDVGNDIWMSARRCPFEDQASSRIGFFNGKSVLMSFEDHPSIAPEADPDLEENFMVGDPSVQWAMQQYNELMSAGYDKDDDRVVALADFIREAREMHIKKQQESEFMVPDWALESLAHAQDIGDSFDPQLVEGGQPASLKLRAIASAPSPSYLDVMKFHGLYEEYNINCRNMPAEYAVAVKDGLKQFGPFGQALSSLTLQRPANWENPSDCQKARQSCLVNILTDYGFKFTSEYDADGIMHVSLLSGPRFDNVDQGEAIYNRMAEELQRINSTNTIILQHQQDLTDDLYKDAIVELAKKKYFRDPITKKKMLLKDILRRHYPNRALRDISFEEVADCILPEDTYRLQDQLTSKVEQDTYLLQVQDNYGFYNVAITKDPVMSELWKDALAVDIPFFMGDPEQRDTLGMPSAFYSENPDADPYILEQDEQQVDECYNLWLEQTKLSAEQLAYITKRFNVAHRVKRIPSRKTRATMWLGNEMQMTTAQIRVARDALAMLGRSIIDMRQAYPAVGWHTAWRKIPTKLSVMMQRWNPEDPEIPWGAIVRIANGAVDMVFTVEEKDLSKVNKQAWLAAGYISKEEAQANLGYFPVLSFNQVLKGSQVFDIVQGYKVSAHNQQLANELLEIHGAEEPQEIAE